MIKYCNVCQCSRKYFRLEVNRWISDEDNIGVISNPKNYLPKILEGKLKSIGLYIKITISKLIVVKMQSVQQDHKERILFEKNNGRGSYWSSWENHLYGITSAFSKENQFDRNRL